FGVAIVMDGRLDARDDLARALNIGRSAEVGDCALVAAAYARWGLDCFARLIGDFAIVLWDSRLRRAIAARDVFGVRPLYYRHTPSECFLASELSALTGKDRRIRPNEGMVGECLARVVTSRSDTLATGIHRVPPGHVMVFERGRLRLSSYWDPSHVPELRYRTTREYADHLRDLVVASVQARLRTTGAAGVMVSGGVDLSSGAG